MLVSLNWIKEYLDLPVSAEELANKTTLTSQEVSDIIRPSFGLKNIVVGHTKEVKPIPDSDHLNICQVQINKDEVKQIVCGAPNIKEDQDVIVALPGARIKDNIKIKRGKMRGYISEGMICSLDELGFSNNVIPKEVLDGIYVFDPKLNLEPGSSAIPYLGMDDEIIDLDLTPNRADLLSIIGCAYEFGAFYDLKPHFPNFSLDLDNDNFSQDFEVKVEDKNLAPIYKLRRLKNVKISSSPQWLKNYLWNSGIRPINNVVDVTNYIMCLYGQPLHAFDLNTIKTSNIVVRSANSKDKIVTLDGIERDLSVNDILITDGIKPLAIAGVMGGIDSEINDNTTDILIESALFDPKHIRETSRRHSLRTEASGRFEKNIDPDTVEIALDHAAYLIKELTGATVSESVLTAAEEDFPKYSITTTAKEISKKIGIELTTETIVKIIDSLSFKFSLSNDSINVEFPHRRRDLTIEADLVEEIARMVGYDKIPLSLPKMQLLPSLPTPIQRVTNRSREIMIGAGFNEVVSYTLISEKSLQLEGINSDTLIKLPNPMTEDHAILRGSLLSGILDIIKYNQSRKSNFQSIFEIGKTFSGKLNDPNNEEVKLAVALSGKTSDQWNSKSSDTSFYDLSGYLDLFMKQIGISKKYHLESAQNFNNKLLHPGQSGYIILDNKKIGIIGKIHPALQKELSILDTYLFEINLNMLLEYPKDKITKIEVPKLNFVKRDLSFFVSKNVNNYQITSAIESLGIKDLVKVEVFDVFSEKGNETSFAYSLTFQSSTKTLTDDELNSYLAQISEMLEKKFSVIIR